ncbi:SEC-C domain-containing protein [Streptomyces himalayensis]|uniref:SEC-C domain-containing protein n=1 Tax=Streptomyces himalayensis subsp. himalayensis TaxID=2756131 RepID=A0A7W0DR50_9ACTN|nr:SEC-C domain-containing protein [Streptomyces himalayensis]MBA2949736.1 SEC-C domain-containing protein [Streptomyces himalayensis subsp. himalayensis]
MRPDMPADLVDHIAEAERMERTAGLYPEDAEHLLLQAAAHLELAEDRERATTLYDRLLSSSSPTALENPQLVKALKAANLWEYGHEAEARAIIDGVRAAAPNDAAPWVIVAEALEAHDELEAAQETFTQAVALLLADKPDPPQDAHPVLFGRHRVRRMLGAPHDEWDTLADSLHTSSSGGPSPVSLDELHDPKRVWSLGSEDPAELRAEISRLRAELGSYREALSRPFPVAVLHWPAPELTELLTAYPDLTAEYPSHEEHLATVESSLRELAASGTPNLGIVTATVPSYEAFAASEASSPSDASLLPQYATTLAARGRAVAWPPRRDEGCWCGSGRVYGECHGMSAVVG